MILDMFDGTVGLVVWGWLFLLGGLSCVAWAIMVDEAESLRPKPELAPLAVVGAATEWSPWEVLAARGGV